MSHFETLPNGDFDRLQIFISFVHAMRAGLRLDPLVVVVAAIDTVHTVGFESQWEIQAVAGW